MRGIALAGECILRWKKVKSIATDAFLLEMPHPLQVLFGTVLFCCSGALEGFRNAYLRVLHSNLQQIACFTHCASPQCFILSEWRQGVVCTQVPGSSARSLGWPDTTAELEAVQFHYGVIPKLQAGRKLVGAQQNSGGTTWFLD